MRLLGYLYGKRFGWKPLVRRADGEGSWPSTETGCGRQRPKVETSSTYVRKRRRCVEARHGSHGLVEIKLLCFRWLSQPSTACFSTRPRLLLPIGSGYFRAKPFPVQIPPKSHPGCSSCLHRLRRWNGQSVPKCRHIKYRRREIAQKKEYNKT